MRQVESAMQMHDLTLCCTVSHFPFVVFVLITFRFHHTRQHNICDIGDVLPTATFWCKAARTKARACMGPASFLFFSFFLFFTQSIPPSSFTSFVQCCYEPTELDCGQLLETKMRAHNSPSMSSECESNNVQFNNAKWSFELRTPRGMRAHPDAWPPPPR